MNFRIKYIILYLLCTIISGPTMAQQYASLLLSATGSVEQIAVDSESVIKEGHVIDTSVLLVEFNAGQNVHMDFNILEGFNALDSFTVVLIDTSNGDYYGYRVSGGDIEIVDAFGSVSLGVTNTEGYQLNIIRCDTTIFYVHEDNVIICRELSSGNNFQLNGQVTVFEALDTDIDIGIESNIDCDYICEKIEEQYLSLENFIEWREHVITEPQIKFKYVEKYAISSENDEISCLLFRNDDGALAHSSPQLVNKYGINLQTWNIPGLVEGNYVLEISGMNKGQKHRIRIRYND